MSPIELPSPHLSNHYQFKLKTNFIEFTLHSLIFSMAFIFIVLYLISQVKFFHAIFTFFISLMKTIKAAIFEYTKLYMHIYTMISN